MANSIEGGVTGFGADIIIVDDPMKAQDALSQGARDRVIDVFDGTLMQRFNDPERPRMIVVMQRLHEADLVGTLKTADGWQELCLPAIATQDEDIAVGRGRCYHRRESCALHPARQSLEELLRRKAANPYVFVSQFQQDPIPAVGNIIEAEWLQVYDPALIDHGHGQIVMSLDTASKTIPSTTIR